MIRSLSISALLITIMTLYAGTPVKANGTYTNPIIDMDYSDPDICRRGADYYLTASSFNCVPGLPVLHSRDLVHWRIAGHALSQLEPNDKFDLAQHGKGVFAPSIRVHNDSLYIYYSDPDQGIFMVKAKDPEGPWEKPVMVKEGRGYIDPCPLWDDDGQAYIVFALAGSRVRQSGVLLMNRLSADGTRVTDGAGRVIYDGHGENAVIEGPKLYKHGGYYWIFAPAGGVGNGYQLAMRSKDIWGPYEWRIVLSSGPKTINGPHQGGWVTTPDGHEDWFVHFQHKKPVGRVIHLQPMKWRNDGWPVMGDDSDGDGRGLPVREWKLPSVDGGTSEKYSLLISDEFNGRELGPQWQWHANPKPWWYYAAGEKGLLRLFATVQGYEGNLWQCPNLMLQKFPGEAFTMEAKMTFTPSSLGIGERAGFIVMGNSYATFAFEHPDSTGVVVRLSECRDAGSKISAEQTIASISLPEGQGIVGYGKNDSPKPTTVWVRMEMKNSRCTFSYSWDGAHYKDINHKFLAQEGKWIGAKMGFFCNRPSKAKGGGWLDVDYIRVNTNVKR